MAIRKDIRDALKKDILDITVAKGYINTIGKYYSGQIQMSEVNEFPSFTIIPLPESTETFGDGVRQATAEFGIVIFVKSFENVDINDIIDSVKEDLEDRFDNATSLDALCESYELVDFFPSVEEEGKGFFTSIIKITYLSNRR